ncbi:MAG TPA: 16S rRNA (guanine(966)-N(2))-methyltransferase RsmD [Bacteroidota bacterium]|nr:16S rRNA (guanine(966)-N(2))-methyltransferase RsmD [Bacteroidota bacterium]
MRIIAGTLRGRILAAPRDRSVRPTTDRVKQSIFDMLATRMDLEGIEVLDLFSGSGSLGLEALSRGAAAATFVDTSRDSLSLLEKNIRSLGLDDRTTVHQAEVFWFLKNLRRPYDLVFADPPFALERIGELPTAISTSGVLKPGTYVVMEHGKDAAVDVPGESFELLRKMFGQTVVLIMKSMQLPKASNLQGA